MKQNVSSVMRALEGEVQLTQREAKFNPGKSSLLDKDKRIDNISNINTIHDYNREVKLCLDLQDPSYLFVPPRNL